uniref:Uncharacterized protein n=1 Tax=Panagrolaimus superbus TaxID=310955 RepID=A0A914Y6G9_9BILA
MVEKFVEYKRYILDDNEISDGSDKKSSFRSKKSLNSVFVPKYTLSKSNPYSSILKNINFKNLSTFDFSDTKITDKEYFKMVETCSTKNLRFNCISVNDEYGNDVEIAELLKEIPNIENFEYIFKDNESTSKTAQKLVELKKPYSKLCEFSLFNIQEGFNFEIFGEFTEKNVFVFYDLEFCGSSEFFDELKNAEKNLYSKMED